MKRAWLITAVCLIAAATLIGPQSLNWWMVKNHGAPEWIINNRDIGYGLVFTLIVPLIWIGRSK